MAKLTDHQSSSFVKLIYIGDSSSGKTGSLVSLLEAGYNFRILDMDNGLDSLVLYAKQRCPDRLSDVEFETYRDDYVATKAGPIVRSPKAYVAALEKLTEWSKVEDPMGITVVDSLSAMGKAAFEWSKGMNPGAKDPRQYFYGAQQSIENMLAMLTSESYRQNVIVISHVNYKEVMEGVTRGYPNAIGSAMGPIIPRYFNTLVMAESTGSGANVKRRIKTAPTGVVDLKIPAPQFDATLPLESGLATIFKTLKGN